MFDYFLTKLVRVEVMLETLAKLRGVTFEYTDRNQAGVLWSDLDFERNRHS
ncbi:MAG: hypothetical protein VX910_09985 [Candidatus Latescibacterota bacterium]|nr:hypothetical protein [Candidatus Latescibacterota bacterium]